MEPIDPNTAPQWMQRTAGIAAAAVIIIVLIALVVLIVAGALGVFRWALGV